MRNKLIPSLVIAHLISALYFLSIPNEIKYSSRICIGNIECVSFFAAWFFGEYILYGITHKACSADGKSKLEQYFSDLQFWILTIRGVIYLVQYLEIFPTNSRQRALFIVGYIFLLSLRTLYFYKKDGSIR